MVLFIDYIKYREGKNNRESYITFNLIKKGDKMLNSIYEQRKRLENGYHITLTIPKEDYVISYGHDYNEKNAVEIVNEYLISRQDDGRPHDIRIYDHDISNMIEIQAQLSYVGNEHTEYEPTYHNLFNKLNNGSNSHKINKEIFEPTQSSNNQEYAEELSPDDFGKALNKTEEQYEEELSPDDFE